MREILFRGKNNDDGEWVYGVPVIGKYSGVFMVWVIGKTKGGKGGIVIGDKVMQAEVIPETVGQFTGLLDKNGKKIFEGDIVRCSRGCPHEIIYKKEYGGYIIGGMPAFCLSGIRDGYAWTETEEIIGNIHDNPELLEVPDAKS